MPGAGAAKPSKRSGGSTFYAGSGKLSSTNTPDLVFVGRSRISRRSMFALLFNRWYRIRKGASWAQYPSESFYGGVWVYLSMYWPKNNIRCLVSLLSCCTHLRFGRTVYSKIFENVIKSVVPIPSFRVRCHGIVTIWVPFVWVPFVCVHLRFSSTIRSCEWPYLGLMAVENEVGRYEWIVYDDFPFWGMAVSTVWSRRVKVMGLARLDIWSWFLSGSANVSRNGLGVYSYTDRMDPVDLRGCMNSTPYEFYTKDHTIC